MESSGSANEREQLTELVAPAIACSTPDPEFVSFASLVAHVTAAPIASLVFVDSEKQWFCAAVGADDGSPSSRIGFDEQVLGRSDPLLVPDATTDPRFAEHPGVASAPFIRFFAGCPVHSSSGQTVGALSIMDRAPRTVTPTDQATLDLLVLQLRALFDAREQACAFETMRASLAEAQHIARAGTFEVHIMSGLLKCSDEVYRMLGVTPSGAMPTFESCLAIVHPDDQPNLLAGYTATISDQAPLDVEFRVILDGDDIRFIRAYGRLITRRGEAGPVLAGTAQDITARRRSEQILRQREEQYRLLFESHPEPAWVYDVDTIRFLAVNDAAVRKYGWTREEFLMMTLLQIRPAEEAPLLLDSVRDNPAGFSETRDWRHLLRDGSLIDVEIASAPLVFASREARLVVARDVTLQREAERSLQLTETLRRVASTTARLGGWVVELPGHRVIWSDEIAELFDLPRGSGESTVATLRVQWQQSIRHLLDRCERHGTPFDTELQFTSATERTFWGRAIGEAEHDADGRIVRLRGAFQDITERRRLEQQFLRSQRMESIGTLAGGIAHDLNNTLTPILLSIDLMRLDLSEAERQSTLDAIEASAQRGADMVRQVLTFARGVEGRRTKVEPALLLGDIARMITDTFPRGIVLATRVADALPSMQGDPTQLHQVLLNLAVNARDAMPAGGRLTLSAESVSIDEASAHISGDTRPGPYVVFGIEDSGTGIPRDVIEQIFDPFFTTKETGHGTGLGLSTSLAIVKSHGGFLRVYSEPGNGTTFRVYIPVAGLETSEPYPESTQPPPRGNDELILVVDDEASIRQMARQTLEAFGYRALLASDGADAVAQYAARPQEIACVLTDMMMPVMDGVTTIRVLRRMNPQLRIVAASGLAANGSVAKTSEAGVRHFLPKPYTAYALLVTLRSALDEA